MWWKNQDSSFFDKFPKKAIHSNYLITQNDVLDISNWSRDLRCFFWKQIKVLQVNADISQVYLHLLELSSHPPICCKKWNTKWNFTLPVNSVRFMNLNNLISRDLLNGWIYLKIKKASLRLLRWSTLCYHVDK